MWDYQLIFQKALTPRSAVAWGLVWFVWDFMFFSRLNLSYSSCHSLTALCQEQAVILELISLIPSL